MEHLVAHAVPGLLLFATHEEAAELWAGVLAVVPSPIAMCLMPDHLHVLTEGERRQALAQALSGYAQRRNRRLGRRGPLIRPLPAAIPEIQVQKQRRVERYIHLNPCRAHLVEDPLAWPWSTYRDAVGLSAAPVRAVAGDPVGYHAWTSADTTVSPMGTELPLGSGRLLQGPEAVGRVAEVVSATMRVPMDQLEQRGPARGIWLRACRELTELGPVEIAELSRVSRRTVERAGRVELGPRHDVFQRVLGDPRFVGLGAGDLRRQPRWRWYRRKA